MRYNLDVAAVFLKVVIQTVNANFGRYLIPRSHNNEKLMRRFGTKLHVYCIIVKALDVQVLCEYKMTMKWSNMKGM